jgi:hypothetical protein
VGCILAILSTSNFCHVARGVRDENTGPAIVAAESWDAVVEAAATENEDGPPLMTDDVIDFKLFGKIELVACLYLDGCRDIGVGDDTIIGFGVFGRPKLPQSGKSSVARL